MAYKQPSHDIFMSPGDEGSCPPIAMETCQGKSYPNGDIKVPAVGSVELPSEGDTRNFSGGGSKSDPTPSMPGA